MSFLSHIRTWNIAWRTCHILATGVLFGGHIFGVEAGRLVPWVYLSILSGAVLLFIEAYPKWRYCDQARGLMVLTKALLVCFVPWFWDYRVPILTVVIVLGSIGSHMPRRLRYYSITEKRAPD